MRPLRGEIALGVAKIKKKLIALALLAIFVLVFMLEIGYGSNQQPEETIEQGRICPEGYVALATPEGEVCAEKASFCGCEARYIIVDGSSDDVVCRDLEPVGIMLGGRFI